MIASEKEFLEFFKDNQSTCQRIQHQALLLNLKPYQIVTMRVKLA